MIDPRVRIAWFGAIIFLAMFEQNDLIMIIVACLLFIAQVYAGIIRALLVFLLTGIFPLFVSIFLFHWASSGLDSWGLSDMKSFAIYRIVLRLLLIGATMQLVFLPLISGGLFLNALETLRVSPASAMLVVASLNAVEDMQRSAWLARDAVKARGLARPRLFWPIKELPSLAVSIFSHALRSALTRQEMLLHRNISLPFLQRPSNTPWDRAVTNRSLILLFLVIICYSFWRLL